MKAKVLTHFYGKLDRNMTTETTTQVVIARIKNFFDKINAKLGGETSELSNRNVRHWSNGVFDAIKHNAEVDANYRDNYAAMDLQMYELKNGRL